MLMKMPFLLLSDFQYYARFTLRRKALWVPEHLALGPASFRGMDSEGYSPLAMNSVMI